MRQTILIAAMLAIIEPASAANTATIDINTRDMVGIRHVRFWG
jgi:hypothetical protein